MIRTIGRETIADEVSYRLSFIGGRAFERVNRLRMNIVTKPSQWIGVKSYIRIFHSAVARTIGLSRLSMI